MKRLFSIILGLALMSQSIAKDYPAYMIYDAKGKETDFFKMVEATKEKSYVFFGEYHNNPISHWLQFELTREMFSIHKNHLMLGAEMYEADNQYIIDEYLQGQISEKSFQNEVRLWPNYNTDYKPVMEFAKANKLRMHATNIPRRYANMVYKDGLKSLNALTVQAKSYIVPLDKFEFDSTVNCYKQLMMPGQHGGENMATAQAIKDATMAHFIFRAVKPNNVILHYNGAYHSDNYEGIVYYLLKEVEKETILTISTVTQDDISKLDEENKGIADFIICVPETMTTTH